MIKKTSRFSRLKSILLLAIFLVSFISQNVQAEGLDAEARASNNSEFAGCDSGTSGDSSDDNTTPNTYTSDGNIPEGGLIVGASVFGGKQQGGKWVADLGDNGGNDLGDHGNHLTGTTSFAELGIFQKGTIGDALGKLDSDTKLEIAYKSSDGSTKKIVAAKGDVGAGGADVSGVPPADGTTLSEPPKKVDAEHHNQKDSVTVHRAVDLWYETANLLGFDDGTAVITIHVVDKDTPVTPLGNTPNTDNSDGDSNDATCCTENPATPVGDGTLMGKTNEEKIWNFLVGNDGQLSKNEALSGEQAAGVMGNLKQESGYNPEAKNGIGAFGIAQWLDVRLTRLNNAAREKGAKPTNLNFQVNYLHQESKSRTVSSVTAGKGFGNRGKKEWDTLQKQPSIAKAAAFWNSNFEISGTSDQTRAALGEAVYNKLLKKYPPGKGDSSAASTGAKPVVFLDPGHGGNIPDYTDPKTGLITNETANEPEGRDVLEVANKVKKQLEAAGYTVVMARTKDGLSAADTPKFRERADAAAKAKADIAVSIHTSGGGPNDAWSQKVGTFRQRKDGSHKDTFTASDTASKSQTYAEAIAKARSDAEGHKVGLDTNHSHQTASFGRGGNIKSPGNIPFVALWSPTVPWVYNEIAQDKGEGLSNKRKEAYATGLVKGIEAAVPVQQDGGCENPQDTSGFTGYVLKYAWPNHHNAPYPQKKPEYESAVKKAISEGRYVGYRGGIYDGVDCGGFITTLMIDSGFEPKYNFGGKGNNAGNTIAQQSWMQKNWKRLGTGSDVQIGGNGGKGDTSKDNSKPTLQPGDVAINSEHTFVYVGTITDKNGKKIFDTDVASASVTIWRAPMAGVEPKLSSVYTWYRKK
jgi:N-acetylmuramoyl-L-alanine amidase